MRKDRDMDVAAVADRLRRSCSRREYCSSDILRKASEALGGDRVKAEQILELLKEEKYVDDRRYASAYARDKASIAGWGKVKIRYMLKSKDISRDDINAALEEIDTEKAGRKMDRILKGRYLVLKNDPQCRSRLLRYALGRGYRYDEAMPVIDEMMNVKEISEEI